MAGDITFKAASDAKVSNSADVSNITPSKPSTAPIADDVAVPYLDYAKSKSHPYTVDYFKLGDTWKDPTGGFSDEVNTIEKYFSTKIASGDISNSISAVEDRLKEILKVTNMSKEDRATVKIGTVAAYIKFLQESDGLKHQINKNGDR